MKWRTYKKSGRCTWTCRGRDHLGVERTIAAFRDKTLSRELADNIRKLVECRAQGAPLPVGLASWVQGLPPKTRDRLADFGLLSASSRCIVDHIQAYEAHLQARGNTGKHVRTTVGRIRRVVEAMSIRHWHEMQPGSVVTTIAELRVRKRPLSALVQNYHLRDLKGFARWCVKDGRLDASPIEHLRPLDAAKVRAGRCHERRALTIEEGRRLLEVTAVASEHHGMTGHDRALLYRLALETGLRSSELRSLERGSFDLDSDQLSVTVRSGYTKNRQEATLPLRPETAQMLRPHLATRLPSAPVFSMPDARDVAAMLREDLAAAEIADRDELNRVVDFHALRHTTGTWLAASGVHPKLAQRILRHSTITLTMDRYSHAYRVDEVKAVNMLPDLDARDGEAARATGTTGDQDRVRNRVQFSRTTVDSGGPNSAQCGSAAETGGRAQVAGKTEENSEDRDNDPSPDDQGRVAELADAADLKSASGVPRSEGSNPSSPIPNPPPTPAVTGGSCIIGLAPVPLVCLLNS